MKNEAVSKIIFLPEKRLGEKKIIIKIQILTSYRHPGNFNYRGF
jgi:hypothetical protein